MSQAVSRRPVTAEAWVRSRVNPCVICGGEVALGQGFLRVFQFSLSGSFHPGSILIYHLEKNNGSVGDRGLDA
jgi:hypothetical protein